MARDLEYVGAVSDVQDWMEIVGACSISPLHSCEFASVALSPSLDVELRLRTDCRHARKDHQPGIDTEEYFISCRKSPCFGIWLLFLSRQ